MQELFSPIPDTIATIQTTLTPIRFTRYLTETGGDLKRALLLYKWNAFLAQSLYWPSQTLEVCARNTISKVFANRYGPDWHLSDKFRRQLSAEDHERLDGALDRQRRERTLAKPAVDTVIADLSFGFWTSMLSGRYDVPFIWRKNLAIAFPHLPAGLPVRSVYRPMDDIRKLRNRIAHHEPIFYQRLDLSHREMLMLLGWICPATQWYVENTSLFPATWASKPN